MSIETTTAVPTSASSGYIASNSAACSLAPSSTSVARARTTPVWPARSVETGGVAAMAGPEVDAVPVTQGLGDRVKQQGKVYAANADEVVQDEAMMKSILHDSISLLFYSTLVALIYS